MTARIWKSALALGTVLAVSGAAGAADRDTQNLTGGGKAGSTTMTLGGKGTVEQNATGDTELAHGFYHGGYHHGGWGGYHHGGWGGYGYRGFGLGLGWGGYRPFYGGYYHPFYASYYSYPYYSSYSYPIYYSSFGYGYGGYGCGTGFYLGISGGASTGAPAVNLSSLSTPAKADAPATTTQPISGKVGASIGGTLAPAKTEYKYKAYGEK